MQLKSEAAVRVAATPSSPEPAAQPNGGFGLSRDEGVAATHGGNCMVPAKNGGFLPKAATPE